MIDWDKTNCTYMWIFLLDKNHPENFSQRIDEMYGYSKAKGSEEPKNKFQLLETKVQMFYNKRWLFKSHYIRLYIKNGAFMNLASSIEIFKLYPTYYEINPNLTEAFYNRFFIENGIKAFLDKFYKMINAKKDLTPLMPKSSQFRTKEDYLNTDKVKFANLAQLLKYAGNLLEKKYTDGEVLKFLNECLVKHFNTIP